MVKCCRLTSAVSAQRSTAPVTGLFKECLARDVLHTILIHQSILHMNFRLLPLLFVGCFGAAPARIISLHEQCWREYPLSAAEIQCSGQNHHVEYVQRSATFYSRQFTASNSSNPGPWSYPPICTEILQNIGSKLCVYTSTSFSNGRGISIFTTPDLADQFLKLPPFRDPSFPHSNINERSGNWYTKSLPGKGMGMLAKRDLKFKDRITAYTPALLAYLESELSTAERERFFRIAVSRLPQATRDMYLSLATVYGIESVKCQDVVKANTFQLEVDGHNHLAVFPETSRINHACSPKYVAWIPLQRTPLIDQVRSTISIQTY